MDDRTQLLMGDVVVFTGKRWFDRRHGNTYHSVTVAVLRGSRCVFHGDSGIHYGYDSAYEQTGHSILNAGVRMPEGWAARNNPLWKLRDLNIGFISTVNAVPRKRDL